ncbi:uncharacterized protein LOC109462922 [Arapaima gigas]
MRDVHHTVLSWLTNLCNSIIRKCKIPYNWMKTILIPVYKSKCDPMSFGLYSVIKSIIEHDMKIVELVLKIRISKMMNINGTQFGFMPGTGTTGAIFSVRHVQEKYVEKKKLMFFVLIDLEKAFD